MGHPGRRRDPRRGALQRAARHHALSTAVHRGGYVRLAQTIPVVAGRLVLGTWQGLFLAEHRRAPHRRQLVLHVSGE
ncbi:MAG: hypothetical protein DRQ55_14765 [Planctomycetota bacterium]|nr:MAG: hypothetical protein DRQ55_14765 [Planctomycetota bacterium]